MTPANWPKGKYRDQIVIADAFDTPLPADIQDAFEGKEIEDSEGKR
jgi:hypothetical protein